MTTCIRWTLRPTWTARLILPAIGAPLASPAMTDNWGPPDVTRPQRLPEAGTAGLPTSETGSAPGSTTIDVAPTAARRRTRGALAAAVVGVVALLAAGAFAIAMITGNDEGGAASATDVGTALVDALNDEDLLGVVELLLPNERDVLQQPMIDLLEDLKRLDVLSPEASLDRIGGVDIQITDVEVLEETTNADDITNIVLSGTSNVVVEGERVPLGDLLIDEAFSGERPDLDRPAETHAFDDLRLTTVERDGRWYLSAFYTIAEQARGSGADIPDTGVTAAGAAEPHLAVDEIIDAAARIDLNEVIALLDPTEAEALQRYAPLFLDQAVDAADAAGVTVTVSDATYSVDEIDDDRSSVTIDSITITATAPDEEEPVTATYADGCLTVVGVPQASGEEVPEMCGLGSDAVDEFAGTTGLGQSDEARAMFEAFRAAFEDYDPAGITVHEVDGSWYVSPIRSWSDGLDSVLDALDRDELDRIVEATRAFTTELFASIVGSSTECSTQITPADGTDAQPVTADGCGGRREQ
jgi:hypothetical protein